MPQSGKSVATNYSLEGVEEEDWRKATGGVEADAISSFPSMAGGMSQYSLREVTEEDWKAAARRGEELRRAPGTEGTAALSVTGDHPMEADTSDHSREAEMQSSADSCPLGSVRKEREERKARKELRNEATLQGLARMMEAAHKDRSDIYEELTTMIDARAHDRIQGEGDLRARLERIEKHLAQEEQAREENRRLQKERIAMQAEICRLRGATEAKQRQEVYWFVRRRKEWEAESLRRGREYTEEEEERVKTEIHHLAEGAAERWNTERELPEGWGGFEEREDVGVQMGQIAGQMMGAMGELRALTAEVRGYQKQGRDTYAAAQAAAKEGARTREAVDKMKKELGDLEAEVGNELEKLTRAVERMERGGVPTPSPPPMARDMQQAALMRRLNKPPPTTDSCRSSLAPDGVGHSVTPALPALFPRVVAPPVPLAAAATITTATRLAGNARPSAAMEEGTAGEELTEQEILNKELGESTRRYKTPASHADWSGSEEGEEGGAGTKDIEMVDVGQIHPERRGIVGREESEGTPIPQQPARPLGPAGPRTENMSITQLRQHQKRQRIVEEFRKEREQAAEKKGKPTYAQQVAAPVPAPQTRGPPPKGKGEGDSRKQEKNPLEPIKGSIPVDERMIVFERVQGAPQLDWLTVNQVASHVNNALSKVAPPHVRTEKFRVSQRGVLTTTARMGVSATMLLLFKKELIEAARKGDNSIINVRSNESWMELKILVPYPVYRDEGGIGRLAEEIEAENEGVQIPPTSMRWMRPRGVIEDIWKKNLLPGNKASVIFKVPNKEAGKRLLQEIWVAGNKFKAERFIPERADSLCGKCSKWGHTDFRCRELVPKCAMCAGDHRTFLHVCAVATCGRSEGRACAHVRPQCPNCGGPHFA